MTPFDLSTVNLSQYFLVDIAVLTMALTEMCKHLLVTTAKLFNEKWLPGVAVLLATILSLFKYGLDFDTAAKGILTGFILTYGVKFLDSRLASLTKERSPEGS